MNQWQMVMQQERSPLLETSGTKERLIGTASLSPLATCNPQRGLRRPVRSPSAKCFGAVWVSRPGPDFLSCSSPFTPHAASDVEPHVSPERWRQFVCKLFKATRVATPLAAVSARRFSVSASHISWQSRVVIAFLAMPWPPNQS